MIKRIPELMKSGGYPPSSPLPDGAVASPVAAWTNEREINLCMLFGLIRILTVPNNPNTKNNQQAFHDLDTLSIMASFAFHAGTPPLVRADALYTIGDLIRDFGSGQDIFASTVMEDPENQAPRSAVQATIELAVQHPAQSWQDWRLRSAAMYSVQVP